MKLKKLLLTALATVTVSAFAASHSDSPLSKQDPQTNITDVYAFLGTKYDNAAIKVLNVVVQVRPFSEPGDGVIYDKFADDVLYSVHLANPVTGATLIRYDFRFSSVNSGYKNGDTILSYGRGTALGAISTVGDGAQNYGQTYTVTKTVAGSAPTVIATGLNTPPPNVGLLTTPLYNDNTGRAVSGAATFAALDSYTKQTVYSTATGESLFAGPRDDGFYCDIPGIFDFLNDRILANPTPNPAGGFGQAATGIDGFKGFNVLSFAIQIPVSTLPSIAYTPAFGPAATGVGVYASTSRFRSTLRRSDGDASQSGPFIQVNRMGNPFFNEGLVALKDKDKFNRASPTNDSTAFATYALNSEIAVLLNARFGLSLATANRTDLAAVFIPEVLRVNTATEPVRLAGEAGFSRLGFIGGDTTADGTPSGWPNGRRLGDDVADIALTAIASGPAYTTITPVGDAVTANDAVFNLVFPYSATPHSGTFNRKDPAP
ncbi:MAG: DUF4331 domain-containing protein [Opitutae bacterium]|nr:DUF4331 domain-containing protein [Opitutae bacterium]